VLTTRLNAKLDISVDKVQTGFIKGRYIMDGIAASHEIISNGFRNKLQGGMLLTLDFAKIYDMLNWEFIMEVLRARKFRSKLITSIDRCLKGGKSQILVNGNPGRMICSKRGLGQGDPLSPLLFLLAADSFIKMLNLAVTNGVLEGLGPLGFQKQVVSLQYADDTLLFCKSEEEYIRSLKLLLYGSELASSLNSNFDKSSVILLEDNPEVQLRVAAMLNCQ